MGPYAAPLALSGGLARRSGQRDHIFGPPDGLLRRRHAGSAPADPTGTSALSGEALEEQPDRFCELGIVHLDRHSVRTWFDRNGLFAFGITDEDFAG